MTPDLIVLGRVATLEGEHGLGIAEAIAVLDGRVAAVGTRAEIGELAGRGTHTIELAPDEIALPGLTDAHLHLAEGGLTADRVDLTTASTLIDGLALIAQAHARLPSGSWLQGHGWQPDRWDCWPTADDLSSAAPGRRIALWAHDHHALWASHAALRSAGVGARTDHPPGGVIRRLGDGSPSGILHEAAARLVTSQIPQATADEVASGIASLGHELVRLGVVAVHDPGGLSLQMGLGPTFEAYRRLAERDDLPLRVHACIREEQLDAAEAAGIRSGDPIGPVDGWARMGWLKLFADGTLGSRTAVLLEPLTPDPGRPLAEGTEGGVWMTDPARMKALAGRAAELGIATTIHAIGDGAVRAALNALEPTAGRTRFAPRLEHIQLLDPADLPRFAQHAIAASVQPVHLRNDAAIARRSWGDRAESRGYPLASIDNTGALLAFGTDAPVESIDPWPGLEMAVTRSSAEWPTGVAPFAPHEALTLDRALRAQCVGAPQTAGEADRGRLTPGQRADLVVIPAAALDEPIEVGGPLGSARSRLVMIDGDIVYEA